MTATDLTVALTFDDGPGPSTERLLDVLAAHGARATFFVLGRNLRGEALHGDEERAMAVAARVAGDGHVLGNHTVTHALRLTEEALRDEIAECDALVRRCYARAERPALEPIPVRLPFGRFRFDWRAARAALERIGRSHCDWSGDFGDWRPDRTASEIANDMISHVEGMWAKGENPVILLHDAGQGSGPLGARYGVVRETTVDATALFCQRMAERSVRYTTFNRASL